MNIKHAKLLRLSALHFIARTINQTPPMMKPDHDGINRAAKQLQVMVLELWPKLNAKQHGKVAQQLERSITHGHVRVVGSMDFAYPALNDIARSIVTMARNA